MNYYQLTKFIFVCVPVVVCMTWPLTQKAKTCGYDACPKTVEGRVNVHLVTHTHDDVGWLRTVDQYYYYEVQFILDTVVDELLQNPARKFTYVEIAYFYRWWLEQTVDRQKQVKQLINEGRLQFALGGWCMDDEATTHYVDIVDQHTRGLRFLEETFGECGRPRVAWQVDPFGHSREHAGLLAQLGYDAVYFGRIDYQDDDIRRKTQSMEMVWKTSDDPALVNATLFSGKLYDSYCTPGGWCFECGDEPIQDDANLYDYNVLRKVKEFVAMVTDRHKAFKSKHIMLTMGCDFQYQDAKKNFKIYDKLIKYVNQYSSLHNISVAYSTPSCYTKALNGEKLEWPEKKDDFFPYASRDHSFWTGYFTSRAALKYYVRKTSNFLQICKNVASLSGIQKDFDANKLVDYLRRALGVAQHHDGVSGTEKQVVAFDYALRLANGTGQCEKVMQSSLTKLTNDKSFMNSVSCSLLNISFCAFTETSSTFYVQLQNSASHAIWRVVRLPVMQRYFVVTNEAGALVTSQTIPINNGTKRIPERNSSKALYELVFNVTNIPAMGWVIYSVKNASAETPGASVYTPIKSIRLSDMDNIDDVLRRRKRETGNPMDQEAIFPMEDVKITHRIAYYFGFQGNNSEGATQASGAYIFRPTKQTPEIFPGNGTIVGQVSGPVVQELHISWSEWVYEVVRTYPKSIYKDPLDHEVIEWTVGPIPFADKKGREIILQYQTDLKIKDNSFFTDANGRQMLNRTINYRPSWKFNQTEPVAGNYYPINSAAALADDQMKFVVLTDRSQGGGCAKPGQLEIMLHRITIDDDSLGVGEPLQERGSDGKGLVIRGEHWIFTSTLQTEAYKRRELALRQFKKPHLSFFAQAPTKKVWSGLRSDLPKNINVLTLEDWDGTLWKLLRLEHLYQHDEDASLSKPVVVDIQNLFSTFKIVSAIELTLGANQVRADATRLTWNSKKDLEFQDSSGANPAYLTDDSLKVALSAMEIRTFAVKVTYS